MQSSYDLSRSLLDCQVQNCEDGAVKQPTTKRGRQTRQRIVAAATDVVSERGVAGASLDEVGARASTSRSQLYHYFADKDELLRAVAEATNDLVLNGQRPLFDRLGSWDGFTEWADALVTMQVQLQGRGGCPIASLVSQLGERDDDVRAELAMGFDRWEAEIRVGLAHMVTIGELRADTDVDWLASSTLATLQGGLVLTQAHRDPRVLRRALDGALALIASFRRTP
jgi:TetR/AcrR family transcriptional regulator, transcriptional repressor for nem operon